MKIAIVVVFACASGIAHANPSAAQLAKDRAAAAERVYNGVVARMKAATATADAVGAWSIRWLDAALDNAKSATDRKQALEDHLGRMRAIEAETTKMKAAGVVSTTEADTATYFRIEAELWVVRGKR